MALQGPLSLFKEAFGLYVQQKMLLVRNNAFTNAKKKKRPVLEILASALVWSFIFRKFVSRAQQCERP